MSTTMAASATKCAVLVMTTLAIMCVTRWETENVWRDGRGQTAKQVRKKAQT